MHSGRPRRIPSFLRRFGHWLRGERYVQGKVLRATVAGVLAIVALAIIFLVATHDSVPLEHLRGSSLEGLRLSADIEEDLRAMENAHRDYLISGDEAPWIQFEQARTT